MVEYPAFEMLGEQPHYIFSKKKKKCLFRSQVVLAFSHVPHCTPPSSDLTNRNVVTGMIVALHGRTQLHNSTRVNGRFTAFTQAAVNLTCEQYSWELLKITYHSAVAAYVSRDAVHVGNIFLNRSISKNNTNTF